MSKENIRAVPVWRDPIDVKAYARALIQLVIEQERKRQAQHAKPQKPKTATSPKPSGLVK